MAAWPYSTAAWQRLRRLKLKHQPCCEACLGRGWIEPASVVDHRVPISAGGSPYPPLEGLCSLCVPCHNGKSGSEQRGEDWSRRGCDVFGRPNDLGHHWYQTDKPK